MNIRELGDTLMVDFAKQGGLVPAIVQDGQSGEVLMLGFVNAEALKKTLETGKLHFYSRSRQTLWMKGETSGHVQEVREILLDCDQDALLFKVRQHGGAACHQGYRSCFYRRLSHAGKLDFTQSERVFDPQQVYQK